MRELPSIRFASQDEYDLLGEVMYDAVRHGPSDYTEEQRQAWVPEPRSGTEWHNRLRNQSVFVAVDVDTILGFMSLKDYCYIDLAYIRPAHQGSGLFRRLLNEITKLARRSNAPRIWVHASLMAQPAFGALGFRIVQEEVVELGGQSLHRYEMEKSLC